MVYGWSWCHLDTDLIPCGPRNRSSSSICARIRRSLSSLTRASRRRPSTPGTVGSAVPPSRSSLRAKYSRSCSLTRGNRVQHLRGQDCGGAQREQPDQGSHLDPPAGAVGHPEHVVEEPVLLVPHLVGVVAQRVHGGGDLEPVLHELDDEVLVRRVVLGQRQGQLEHALAEERHPGGAVGLLQGASARELSAAIEDPDVVQAEESAMEQVLPAGVLPVDPPGEVHQQHVERLGQERPLAAFCPGSAGGSSGVELLKPEPVDERQRGGVHRGVHVAEVPLVGRDLTRRVQVRAGEHQRELLPARTQGRPSPAAPCGTRGPTPRTRGTPTCPASR